MNWKLIGGIGLIIAALCIVLVYNYTKEPPEKAPSTGPPSAIKPVQPKTGSLALEFYSSSAKRTWINEVTAAFNAQDHRVDGKQIVVEVTHVTSGGSFRNIKEGKIKPDIWSPGDDSWIKLANVHWNNIHLKTLMPTTKPLVNVPLIIAMWEPMAQALGYPDKPVGWTDIARIAADPKRLGSFWSS